MGPAPFLLAAAPFGVLAHPGHLAHGVHDPPKRVSSSCPSSLLRISLPVRPGSTDRRLEKPTVDLVESGVGSDWSATDLSDARPVFRPSARLGLSSGFPRSSADICWGVGTPLGRDIALSGSGARPGTARPRHPLFAQRLEERVDHADHDERERRPGYDRNRLQTFESPEQEGHGRRSAREGSPHGDDRTPWGAGYPWRRACPSPPRPRPPR